MVNSKCNTNILEEVAKYMYTAIEILLCMLLFAQSAVANEGNKSHTFSNKEMVKVEKKLGKPPKKYGLQHGKQIYDKICSTCHQDGNLGAPKLGDNAAWKQRKRKGMEVLFYNVIHAYPASKDHQACVIPNGGCKACSDAELIATVKYMVQQSTSGTVDISQW